MLEDLSASYDHSTERNAKFWGLLQITCALRVPQNSSNETTKFDNNHLGGGLLPETISEIKEVIRSIFQTSHFRANSLAETLQADDVSRAQFCMPNHTWLGIRSRHISVTLDQCFYQPSEPLPSQLNFRTSIPEAPPSIRYLRAQVAVNQQGQPYKDPTTGKQQAPEYLDAADYIIGPSYAIEAESGGTISATQSWALQRFLAQLFAHRKQMIFASDLSERMYHIWLPPGTLEPISAESSDQYEQMGHSNLGPLAICPFVTFVRHPHEPLFRRTIAVNAVCVAIADPDGQSKRAFGLDEIPAVLETVLQSTSTHIPSWAARLRYRLSGPLADYFDELTAEQQHQRPLASSIVSNQPWHDKELLVIRDDPARNRPAHVQGEGTLRQWMELLVTLGAERGVTGRGMPWGHGRDLADEILSSFRISSAWCTLVLDDGLVPLSEWKEYPDGSWAPELPPSVTQLLERLMMRPRGEGRGLPRRAGAFPIELFDRIDLPATYSGDYLIWHVPGRRGMVAAYPLACEQFPNSSSLTLFGFLGHMVIGASCSIDMSYALVREALRQPNTSRRARSAHELLIELEQMFDLDMAWEAYRIMWRQFVEKLRLDDQYRMAIDRTGLLARYADAEEREESHVFEQRVTFVGAGLALGILMLAGASLFAMTRSPYTLAICAVIAAAAVVVITMAFVRRRTR